MEFGIGAMGFLVLLLGAVVVGFAAQAIGASHFSYEWLIAGIAAIIGAYVASELLGQWSTWGMEFDGLYLVPAAIGAVILGGIADLVVRMTTNPRAT
jgi:uncharacterized membrane protein YeaQ/YmgE (transglycosylase-associated protein family)